MEQDRYIRQRPLLGDTSPELLGEKSVLLCGVGGVGGYVLEALVRAGIGHITVVDSDRFEMSNLNRQLLATTDVIGKEKALIARERAKAINPNIDIFAEILFLTPDNIPDLLNRHSFDYIVDAIDNITAKLTLAVQAEQRNIPIVSSMGTGNKLNSNAFECTDIYKTSVCPLAKAMRRLLKERGVKHLKVVYSKEEPRCNGSTVSSVSFVPAAAGLLLAETVIKDLLNPQA